MVEIQATAQLVKDYMRVSTSHQCSKEEKAMQV